jgi:Cft2 family RNA processing exonuclease
VLSQIRFPSFPGVNIACKSDLRKADRVKFQKVTFLLPPGLFFGKKIKVLPKVTEINKDIEFLSTSTL